ncbi:MAG TPA: hypothetical protein VGO18_24805 [Steroidobacteraceae bacterium]|jgi:hypothetical protein|nr:hypothetical protein [Steroidobacteraceae bacterium]
MTETTLNTYPFALEVTSVPNSSTRWQWTIRRHGKVYQRCDRRHHSEAKAREDGLEVIEKLLTGVERA